MVEIHKGCSIAILGRSGSFELAEKAIGNASLRRIQMVNTGKETTGLEGNGNNINGEPSNVEADTSSCSSKELRCADMLQGRYGGNTEIHDNMETEVEELEGIIEDDRMEYGGSCHDES